MLTSMNSAVFTLPMREAEFHLENTLLNGQCFNWWRQSAPVAGEADSKEPHWSGVVYRGVYSTYCVQLQRLSPDVV